MKKILYFSMMFAAVMLAACNNGTPDDPGAIVGGLTGVFSVSATQKVVFSQGNLQYNPAKKTWMFAESQNEVAGTSNDNIAADYDGLIDLFVWGATDPIRQDFEDKDFGKFNDWGNNKISNGGNKAKQWRTLSLDEWKYLYEERANADKLRGFATIKDQKGYVFLPDEWELPESLSFTPDGKPEDNEYTTAKWGLMQEAGAIFLPEAGMSYADSEAKVDYINQFGYYWSANLYEGEIGDCYCFYAYSADGSVSVNPENIAHGAARYSVRLVKNIN